MVIQMPPLSTYRNAYRLEANGELVLSVMVESPAWLPATPQVPRSWLRGLISRAWRHWQATH